ncbi:hypothetical protein BDZ91DRAFT_760808 [Kalaharituber pfeilii]|nr:hypothetical protein BDZ91DRAFT_760808 [Kalaharituber pfeilii]
MNKEDIWPYKLLSQLGLGKEERVTQLVGKLANAIQQSIAEGIIQQERTQQMEIALRSCNADIKRGARKKLSTAVAMTGTEIIKLQLKIYQSSGAANPETPRCPPQIPVRLSSTPGSSCTSMEAKIEQESTLDTIVVRTPALSITARNPPEPSTQAGITPHTPPTPTPSLPSLKYLEKVKKVAVGGY